MHGRIHRDTLARRASMLVFGVISLAGLQHPALSADASAVAASAPADPPAAPAQQFDIHEFRVLGNSLLPQRAIESAVYPFLGDRKTIDAVQHARDALAAAYRNAGYGSVLVDIPEQSVDAGIVRLQVVEGRLERVQITGATYFSERRILHELPSLKPGATPSLPQLQAELAQLATETADRQITPVLKAGSEPGTMAIDLKVHDELPLHGSLQLDDRYTADTVHDRLTGILSYENMFQRAETLSLQYETSPAAASEVRLWALTYLGRTADPDLTWSVYAIRSYSNVAAVGTLSVIGDGKIIGARLIRALPAFGSWSSALTLGGDYKSFGQMVNLSGGTSESPEHYFLWSAQYAGSTHHDALDLAASLAVNFAVRGLGTNDAALDVARSGAQSNFIYLRGGDSVAYHLWHGSALAFRVGYQYSETPLLSNEQLALGGFDTVRGYLEAESLQDAGFDTSVELQVPPLSFKSLRSVGFAFFDTGYGLTQQALADQAERVQLESVGVGFRATGLHGLDAMFDWADPLRDGPRTFSGRSRVDFSIKYGY